MSDPDAVRDGLARCRARIAAAGGGDDVAVLPVTKGFGPDAVDAAIAAGCSAIGENYAQELLAKLDALGSRADAVEVHMIGRLQTNKVRALAGRVACYQSIDRPRLAREIAHRDPGAHVLVQVDTADAGSAGGTGKGGCPVDAVEALVDTARSLGLEVDGLMTVGPTTGGPEAARPGFAATRRLVDRLGLSVCSMGMSADLEVAVGEGSTMVRLGTAIFGARPVRTTN